MAWGIGNGCFGPCIAEGVVAAKSRKWVAQVGDIVEHSKSININQKLLEATQAELERRGLVVQSRVIEVDSAGKVSEAIEADTASENYRVYLTHPTYYLAAGYSIYAGVMVQGHSPSSSKAEVRTSAGFFTDATHDSETVEAAKERWMADNAAQLDSVMSMAVSNMAKQIGEMFDSP